MPVDLRGLKGASALVAATLAMAACGATAGTGSNGTTTPSTSAPSPPSAIASASPSPTPPPSPSGPLWDYVDMGDSFATGYLSARSYPSFFASFVEDDTGARVDVTDLAENGMTSEQLLDAVRDDPTFRDALGQAEIVTWNIGGNDTDPARLDYLDGGCGGADGMKCLRSASGTLLKNWEAILVEVLSLTDPQRAIVRVVNCYYPYVDEDREAGAYDELHAWVEDLYTQMDRIAQEHGVPLADVYHAFNGPLGDQDPAAADLLARDGIHPSYDGQRAAAEVIRALGYAPLG